MQDAGTMTEPPPKVRFSSNVSQWEIFDAYIEDFEKQVIFVLLTYLVRILRRENIHNP